MNTSDKNTVTERLEEIHKHFDQLIKDIQENPFDRLWIKTKYGSLKMKLKTETDIFHTLKGQKNATKEEIAFYYPAVSEAFNELTVKIDAPPNQKMTQCLISAQGLIEYYLKQIQN